MEGERLRTAFELASSQSTLLRSGESSHVMGLQLDLKTLFNPKDKEQITSWLQAVRPTSSCLWGKVVPAPDGSLSDGFRMCMDQKPVNPARLSYPGSEVGCPLGPNPLAEGVQNGAGAGPEGRRDSARGVSQRRARAKESAVAERMQTSRVRLERLRHQVYADAGRNRDHHRVFQRVHRLRCGDYAQAH